MASLGQEQPHGPKLDLTVLTLSAMLWVPLILVSAFEHPSSVFARRLLDALTSYGPALPGFYFLQREYRPGRDQFGMSWQRLKARRVWYWTITSMLPVCLLWFTLAAQNFDPARVPPGGTPLPPLHSGHPVLSVVILIVIAPAVEELFFRGYLYLLLEQNWGRTAAAILSSSAFALLHGWHAPLMFLWSLLNIYFNDRARSLCPSLAAHAMWNAGFLLYSG